MTMSEDARQRLIELWIAAFGEPPIVNAPPGLLAEVLVGNVGVATYPAAEVIPDLPPAETPRAAA
jgi:hypothetical protein